MATATKIAVIIKICAHEAHFYLQTSALKMAGRIFKYHIK